MFNRNARNRLSSMGGIASFQSGGATRNPQLYFSGSTDAKPFADLALKAYNQGISALSPGELSALTGEIALQTGRKAMPVEGNISQFMAEGSPARFGTKLLENVVGFGRDLATQTGGRAAGGLQSLFIGKPDPSTFFGRLSSGKPSLDTMKTLGFKEFPPTPTSRPANLVPKQDPLKAFARPPIAGGPTYQDPTLVDPRDPAVIKRIQQGIDAKKLADQGKAVSVDPITGEVTETLIQKESPITKPPETVLEEQIRKTQLQTTPLVEEREEEGADGVDADAEFARPLDEKIDVDKEYPEVKTKPKNFNETINAAANSNKNDGIIKQDTASAEIKTASEKGTGSPEDLKAEFLKLLPKYDEDPSVQGLEIAQMFFNIAAGDSPDALTNIADGLRKSVPAFIKRKDRRKAFERETELLAAKYVIQRREADRNRGFQKTDFYVTKDFTGPDGQKYTKGQPLRLNDQAFSLLEKQGLSGNLVSGTIYGKMLDNAAKVEKERIKNSGKGLDDLYQGSSKTVKIGENIEIEVFYPTVTGGASGLKARPAGGLDAWKSVTRGYINDVNAIGQASNSLDSAINLVSKEGALGTPGLLGRITDATKGVVPESIGRRMGLDYNKLSAGGKLENLQRVMALQMARIILNEGGKMISNLERLQVARALGYTDASLQGTGPGAQLILGSYSNVFTSNKQAEDSLRLVQNILKQRAKKTHSEYQKAGDLFGYKLTGIDDKPKKGEKPKTITGKTLTLRDGKYYYE